MGRRTLEIDAGEILDQRCTEPKGLKEEIVQSVDLTARDLTAVCVEDTYFFDCTFRDIEQQVDLMTRGAKIFPRFEASSFNPYRASLYTTDELLEGWDEGGYPATRDFRIYTEFDRARNRPGAMTTLEAMSQRIHDHAVDDALYNFLETRNPRSVVAIMGGHGTKRNDPWYAHVAKICWQLTRDGFLIASGGGPGIMEAANLGAYLANYSVVTVVDEAIEILSQHPKFDGGFEEGTPEYLDAIVQYVRVAKSVRDAAKSGSFATSRDDENAGVSIAIPTWFYGHEPTNLFCDHVAKYFSNGIREDTLLAIARGGVIFAPGSAGTMQEVFMDLAQNHYATFVDRSPMCFLGRHVFTDVYALIEKFVAERSMETVYGDLVMLTDEPAEIIQFLHDNPPRMREKKTPLYEHVKATK